MGFAESVKTVFVSKYADFSGRASRSEYWNSYVALMLLSFALSFLDKTMGSHSGPLVMVVMGVYLLAIFIPIMAVQVRRLHDTDRGGLWILVALIPLLGGPVLLVLNCLKGSPEENRFGPPPLA